tara:strand:+ start:116 stop:886 length:771 start_codon:yes stop_codon:yes gene_type:complete
MKVSIITVVRNNVNSIERCYLSVVGQTYKNIEYIIIDGNSTDGTSEWLQDNIDSSIRYIREDDKGLYDAMNKGVKHSTGEIIGIVNSDDFISKDYIEKVVGQAVNIDYENSIFYTDYMLVDEHGESLLLKNATLNKNCFHKGTGLMHTALFIGKGVFHQVGLYDLSYEIAADSELILRAYQNGVPFVKIEGCNNFMTIGGVSGNRIHIARREYLKALQNNNIKFNKLKALFFNLQRWIAYDLLGIDNYLRIKSLLK